MSGSRDLDSDFLDALRETNPGPVILLEIATGDVGTPYIRMCSFDRDIDFPSSGGETFTARPFMVEEIKLSGTDLPGLDVTIPDVDLEMDTWFQSTDLRYQKVSRYLVERGSLDSSAKAVVDTFRIRNRSRGHYVTILHLEPLAAILQRLEVPKRTISREDYPAIPNEGVVR